MTEEPSTVRHAGRARLIRNALVIVVALAAGYAGYALYQRGAAGGGSVVDAPRALAGTRLVDLTGASRTLTEWPNRVVVVNFWATWCPPCREEIPGLIATRGRYGARGMEVVGVAIDTADKVRPFAAQFGIDYPLLLGEGNAIDLMRQLGNATGALPYTIVLDRHGKLATRHLGLLSPEQLGKLVEPLL